MYRNSVKSPSTSCVACGRRGGTNLLSQIKMYNFPTIPSRRQAWEEAVNRPDWRAPKNPLICNLHFISGKPSSDPKDLDYVPSIFPQIINKEEKRKYARKKKNVPSRMPLSKKSPIIENPDVNVQNTETTASCSIIKKNIGTKPNRSLLGTRKVEEVNCYIEEGPISIEEENWFIEQQSIISSYKSDCSIKLKPLSLEENHKIKQELTSLDNENCNVKCSFSPTICYIEQKPASTPTVENPYIVRL